MGLRARRARAAGHRLGGEPPRPPCPRPPPRALPTPHPLQIPLAPPPRPLLRNAVYVPRMNAKGGVCDKFAFGLREPMRAYLRRVHHVPLASRLLNTSRDAPAAARGRTLSHFAIWTAPGRDKDPNSAGSSLLVQQPLFPRQHTGWQFGPSNGPNLHAHMHRRRKNSSLAVAVEEAVGPVRSFRMSSEGFAEWSLWRANVTVVYTSAWALCKFSDATNWTARTCVPRMRRRQTCSALICEGQATDCKCRVDGLSCADTQAWYCTDVQKQIGVDGVAFGPADGSRLAAVVQEGCASVNSSAGKRVKFPLQLVTCKWVPPS